jgi:dihydroflavonol-4-reductase
MDKAQRIVITGATGLVGSYLARTLVHLGCKNIVAIKRPSSNTRLLGELADSLYWEEGDILDEEFLRSVVKTEDIVLHCAALVSFAKKDVNLLHRINIEATASLVNICLDKKVRQFIHISSVAALGRVKSGTAISEDSEWTDSKENSVYAISKHRAELEVWRGHAEGLKVAIVNPSIILGGAYWHSGSTSIIGSVARGMPYYPVGGTGIVDVRDVVKLILLLIEKEVDGERYICNGHNVSYRQLFQQLAEALHSKVPKRPLPSILGSIAWRAAWLKSLFTGESPMLTKETVRTSKFVSIYKNDKSKQLGVVYRPFHETVSDIASVYKEGQTFALLKVDTEDRA